MKAIVYSRYGSPEVLQLMEVDKPVPGDHEVLVRVHAASVNFGNLALVRGKSYLIRDLIESGRIRPVIDRQFSPENSAGALSYYAAGHAVGKVVINI